MSNSDQIRVRISPAGHQCKVLWEQGISRFEPYTIDRDLLERCAENVRKKLLDLAYEASRGRIQTCGNVLKALAGAGSDLGAALFASNPQSSVPRDVRRWISGFEGRHGITFILDDRIHIPWGLIYDGDVANSSSGPADCDIGSFQGFWSLRFSVATAYSRITPEALATGATAKTGIVIPVFDPGAYEQAISKFEIGEKADSTNLLNCLEPMVSSEAEFFEKWDLLLDESKAAILFFYCHASGTTLTLGQNEEITIDKLLLRVSNNGDHPTERTTLVLMNGCSTATGDEKGGFLDALGRAPFWGFVGTEADIPDVFALRFGQDLLLEILKSDEPIIEIMDRLREKHWPLSLLYSLYCHPGFTFNRYWTGPSGPQTATENYSLRSLGDDLLGGSNADVH